MVTVLQTRERHFEGRASFVYFVIIAFSLLATSFAGSQIDVGSIDRERILKAASNALALEPVTITKFKAEHSEGGPNDFYSNGDYWWPDPSKPDGLPYIQRDGESNPNNFV